MPTTRADNAANARLTVAMERMKAAIGKRHSRDRTYQDEYRQFIQWVEQAGHRDEADESSLYLTREAVDVYFSKVVVLHQGQKGHICLLYTSDAADE